MPREYTYAPHAQLKKIRGALGITQMKLAEMLGVSYPYLLSVETGQRDMSAQLARKISWLVGVPSGQLRKKTAPPMAWDPTLKKLVPFSKETFERRKTQLLTFAPNPDDPDQLVTPSLEGYATAFHAMLDSAQKGGRLGTVLQGFFELFAENFSSDTALDAFLASLKTLKGRQSSDAPAVLTGYVYDIREYPDLYRSQKPKRIQKRKAIGHPVHPRRPRPKT